MAPTDPLERFLREALTRGIPRDQIREALAGAGWSQAQIEEALATFADLPVPLPVPRPRPYTEAGVAFQYAVLFVSMYLSAFHLGNLLYKLIDRAFPTADGIVLPLLEAIRWPVSILAVSVPVYWYLYRRVMQEDQLDPNRRISPLRRKLTWLTLFIAACVLIGVFAGLIYSLLGGELTIRFVLKALTAGGIAAMAFGYYLRDLRLDGAEARG